MVSDGSAPLLPPVDVLLRPGGLQLTERGVSSCRLPRGARVLDVGCGSGVTVSHLRNHHHLDAIGMDLTAARSWSSHQDGGAAFFEGRAEELPIQGGSLDGIVCECVLSLLSDPHAAVKEFSRVLRHDGCVMVSDLYALGSACGSSVAKGACCAGLPGIRTLEEMESMMVGAGFRLLVREDQTALLKQMAARQLLSGGSLDCCPGLPPGALAGPDGKPSAVRSRLGYYLIAACRI